MLDLDESTKHITFMILFIFIKNNYLFYDLFLQDIV